ncbi:MAG: hypothetical protein KIS68_16010, partial [Bauldia sp.]|nr:hypothetical protein [Bauldia sp.]
MDDLELAAGSVAGAEEAGWPEGGGFSEPMTYREKRAAEAAEAEGDGEDERHGRGRSRAARYRARIERLEAEVADLRGGARAGTAGRDGRGDAGFGPGRPAMPRETAAEAAWRYNRAGAARPQPSGPVWRRSPDAGEAAMQVRAA